jgi:hypothetical protein
VAAAGSTPSSSGPSDQSYGIKRPVEVSLKISGWCDNTGSDINLVGDIALTGTGHRVTLANNAKGTHAVEAVGVTDVTISGDQDQLLAVKPPAFGGVGGSPHAVAQVMDARGNVAGSYYLGRCVTGARGSDNPFSANITQKFAVDGGISTFVGQIECSSNRSQLHVHGKDWADGVNAKVLLVSQVNKAPGEPGVHWADADVQAQVTVNLLRGTTKPGKGWWEYDDGTIVHGVGGNPRVYDRAPIDSTTTWSQYDPTTWGAYLGRCNQLPVG